MKLGILDLSIITDRLIDLLEDALAASAIWTPPGPPFSVEVDALPPDVLRTKEGCRLGLYLFHVARDKGQINAPVTGARTRVPAIPHQPLPLQLYYMLTAHCANEPIKEQQVMSIALKCFHESPFVEVTVADDTNPPTDLRTDRMVLTMEQETSQSVGQLWQAIATPMRLSTIYKVGVVFLEPPQPPAVNPKPITYHVSANPAALPLGGAVQIIGTLSTIQYAAPGPDPDPNLNPVPLQFDLSPAAAAHGKGLQLYGANFAPATDTLLLLSPGDPDVDITGWVSGAGSTSTKLEIVVPGAGPAPGIYQLRIQSGTSLSNSTPFSIAALVSPAGGPVLAPDGAGVFTLHGSGFVELATEVFLGGTALDRVSGTPADGEVTVTSLTEILFKLPASLPSGRYPVRVRVGGVESPPAKWVDVP